MNFRSTLSVGISCDVNPCNIYLFIYLFIYTCSFKYLNKFAATTTTSTTTTSTTTTTVDGGIIHSCFTCDDCERVQ